MKVNNSNMSVLSDQTLMDDENKSQIEQIKLKNIIDQQPVTETKIQVKKSVETNTVKKQKERFGSPPPEAPEEDDDEYDDDINNRQPPPKKEKIVEAKAKSKKKNYKTPKRREEDKANKN